MVETTHTKLVFQLQQDEDGYPPADRESLWAVPLGDGRFRIDNIPFFVRLISVDDVVAASFDGVQWIYQRTLAPGGHSTLRVILYRLDQVSHIRAALEACGCSTELSHLPNLVSVDVPPDADYKAVVDLLEHQADQQVLDYEEASIQH